MTRKKGMKYQNNYDTIKIPVGLTRKIDGLIIDSNGDFTSRTDVIKTAVRFLYREELKKKDKI